MSDTTDPDHSGLERFDRFRHYHKKMTEMSVEELELLRADIRDRTVNLLVAYPKLTEKLTEAKTTTIDSAYGYFLDLIVLMGGSLDGLSLAMDPVSSDPMDILVADYVRPNPDEFEQKNYDVQGKRIYTGQIYFKVVSDPSVRFTDKGKSGRNWYITNAAIEVRAPKDHTKDFADTRAMITVFEPTTEITENPIHVAAVTRNHVYNVGNPTCQLENPSNASKLRRWSAKWECAINLRNLNDIGEDVENKF